MAETNIFKVSYTKLGDHRRCVQRYWWKYGMGYYPVGALGQIKGQCGHTALGVWHATYDCVKSTQAAWDKWTSYGYESDPEWQLLLDALNRYYAFSEQEDKDNLEILASEQPFDIDLELPEPVGKIDTIRFNGFIDGIIKQGKKTWLLENKFHKRADLSGLEMDHQVSLYLLAAYFLGHQDVQGVLYNVIRMADTKIAATEPVLRKYFTRSLAGLEQVKIELLRQATVMIQLHQQQKGVYRNPTKDCSWDCSFYNACLSMLDNGIEDKELLQAVSLVRRSEIDEQKV